MVLKNPDLSNKKLNTCVSDLIDWAYHSRLKRTKLSVKDGYNTKPFIIGSHTSLSRKNPTDIHCYISDLFDYLEVDESISNKFDHLTKIKFILEHITPILFKRKIISISFGGDVYVLKNNYQYEHYDVAD